MPEYLNFYQIAYSLLDSVFSEIPGIKFQSGLNWEQVKEKARNENRYIFIDCYATWCGPCKKMDKEVYTSENVGNIFNKNFISIKLQDRHN